MKKLFLVVFVLFLLVAPRIAQADSDNACDRNDPTCVTLESDRNEHDGDECDRDAAGFDGCDRNEDDDDRDDVGERGDRDREDKDKRDKDKEERRDRDRDDDDDDEGEDRDHDDDNDEGEDRDDDDDDDEGDDGEDEGDDRGNKDKEKDKDEPDGDDDEDEGEDNDDNEGEDDGKDDDSEDRPKPSGCRRIVDGGIYTSNGEEIVLGFDRWGYNYQAHKFSGWYENAGRQGSPVETGNIHFKMKWNDVYISNKDCDGDGKLDRHYGYDSYFGTRAWLTNHYSWTYVGDDGNVHWVHWYLKMVAQPYSGFDCASIGGTPFNGAFCTVKNVYYDPYGGSQGMSTLMHGLVYGSN